MELLDARPTVVRAVNPLVNPLADAKVTDSSLVNPLVNPLD